MWLLLLTVSLISLRLAYWFYFFWPIKPTKPKEIAHYPSISVIISAKNEAKNIEDCLISIANQQYPNFEIVAVDDYSTDETYDKILTVAQKFSNIIPLQCTKDVIGKKQALTEALTAAKGEYVLFTDADCKPISPLWIATIVSAIDDQTKIVLGVSPMRHYPGLLAKFCRMETVYTAMQYIGYAQRNQTYMGVGRNLMVHRETVLKEKAYEGLRMIPWGDDDLLVAKLAQKYQTAVALNHSAFVYTNPPNTIKSLIQQKTRHTNASLYYPAKTKGFLGLFAILHASVFVALLILSFYNFIAAIFLIVLMWGIQMATSRAFFRKLEEEKLGWFWPVFDIAFLVYGTILVVNNFRLISKPKW